MSPGGAWKGRVSPGSTGVGSTIYVFWYFHFPRNENAEGSAMCIHKDILPEEAIVTNLITCQGRDHVVNVQSGRQSLVIANVHFEPELTLTQFRERLRLINPHWPVYPNAVGIIWVGFNICEPDEGRFNVWNQTFTDGDLRKTAIFHSSLTHFLEIAQPDYTRRGSTALGIIRTPSKIDRFFKQIYLWLRREIFTAAPMSSRTWGTGPFRVTTRQYVLSFMSQLLGSNNANKAGCQTSRYLLHFEAGSRCHRFSTEPFGALAEFKAVLGKLRSRRFVNSHGRHLTASERNLNRLCFACPLFRLSRTLPKE